MHVHDIGDTAVCKVALARIPLEPYQKLDLARKLVESCSFSAESAAVVQMASLYGESFVDAEMSAALTAALQINKFSLPSMKKMGNNPQSPGASAGMGPATADSSKVSTYRVQFIAKAADGAPQDTLSTVGGKLSSNNNIDDDEDDDVDMVTALKRAREARAAAKAAAAATGTDTVGTATPVTSPISASTSAFAPTTPEAPVAVSSSNSAYAKEKPVSLWDSDSGAAVGGTCAVSSVGADGARWNAVNGERLQKWLSLQSAITDGQLSSS
jgi:hypothetical protein